MGEALRTICESWKYTFADVAHDKVWKIRPSDHRAAAEAHPSRWPILFNRSLPNDKVENITHAADTHSSPALPA